jgi:glutaredoxin
MKSNNTLSVKFCVLLLLTYSLGHVVSLTASAAKLYKWVDANGRISYQDNPPPKNAKTVETPIIITNTEETVNAGSGSPSQNRKTQANSEPVTVYTVANCKGCKQIMRFLTMQEVPVIELSLLNREVQQLVLDLSGKLSAPTVFIGNKLITDLSEIKFTEELKVAGYTIDPDINIPAVENESEKLAGPNTVEPPTQQDNATIADNEE